MKNRKTKVLVNGAMVLAGLTVFACFPANAALGIARLVVTIFAMVLSKAAVEYLISRWQKAK